MAAIAQQRLPQGGAPDTAFQALADTIMAWLHSRDLAARDAIVLLPFAQLLPLARSAFGSGWLPRIETTQTLAAALGPAPPAEPGAPTFDAALDQLVAARMLGGLAWGRDWQRRQPRAFESAVGALVTTAHALARSAFSVAPSQREAWWQRARELMAANTSPGPGEREAMLARVALEWAALAPAPASDRLFELRPAAWVYLQAGSADALSLAVLAQSDSPGLIVDGERGPGPGGSITDWRGGAAPQVAVCTDLEDEAQAAAAQLLAHLAAGQTPVALVANDRAVTRRIHALLARQGVPLADETGWRLSTTRAGASVMAWQRAARHDASTDEVMDALTDTAAPALAALDRSLRRRGIARRIQVDSRRLDPACMRLWQATCEALDAFAAGPAQSLEGWVHALDTLLRRVGARSALDADVAGRQLLAALGLDAAPEAWPDLPLALDDFIAWVDASLEQTSFVAPAAAPDQPPLVVITPMARALLRPFAALVMPACDHKHLGAVSANTSLLGDGLARQLGVPTRSERLADQRSAFWHALRVPHATLLRRLHDGDEPLAVSPLLERLRVDWQRASGVGLTPWQDARVPRGVEAAAAARPAPSPRRLPARLSATQVEALRACPYRFFSRAVLRLDSQDELDDDVEKSDFGTWLHAVLHHFHRSRALAPTPPTRDEDVAALKAAGAAERDLQGLAGAAFLPFAASFEGFVERYVDWQRERDAAGQHWREGELSLHLAPPEFGGIELYGRIDRLDEQADGSALLVDYKTGSSASLAERVKQPLEDTQLAFYAALLQDHPRRGAVYLALDDPRVIVMHEHKHVEQSAQALLEGIGGELDRLRKGATLPALGEGRECDWCEARGLCRRDDWA